MTGVLNNGIQCDFRSFEKLARFEPKALLVAPDDEWSIKKHHTVLDVCDAMEASLPVDNCRSLANFTSGGGVVLFFPKILQVKSSPLFVSLC